MVSRDERRRRVIAGLREVLAVRPTDEYGRKLVCAVELAIDRCEDVSKRNQGTYYDQGAVMHADDILYSLYGLFIGGLPEEWYQKVS